MFVKDMVCITPLALLPLPSETQQGGAGRERVQAERKQAERAITETESMPEGGERGWEKGPGRNLRGQL